jgi:hypothetical protein
VEPNYLKVELVVVAEFVAACAGLKKEYYIRLSLKNTVVAAAADIAFVDIVVAVVDVAFVPF